MSTSVPGLNQPLTRQDLEQSQVEYNRLPKDEDQPDINEHLKELQQIFVTNGVEKILGIHLIHGHFELPRGHILLGENFEWPAPGRWAQTVPNSDVDVHEIYGHIFKYTGHGLHPYEYQRGTPPSDVNPAFLSTFNSYITDNKLESLIGLEVLCPEFEGIPMSEIVMEGQTLMWETETLKIRTGGRKTGWSFSREAQQYTAGEEHEPLGQNNHRKWNEGAPLPKTVQGLHGALVKSGIVRPPTYQSSWLVE